jgi:hypothetical protein
MAIVCEQSWLQLGWQADKIDFAIYLRNILSIKSFDVKGNVRSGWCLGGYSTYLRHDIVNPFISIIYSDTQLENVG